MSRQIEHRVAPASFFDVEVRQDGHGRPRLVGRIPYNVWSATMRRGDGRRFREIIRPGAFRRSIASRADVKARVEHKDGLTRIGRVKNGTLRLRDTPDALTWEVDPPDTTAGRDIVALARRGDIDDASFAFRVPSGGERWSTGQDGLRERELVDVELVDVAPVSSPAYEDTAVAVRALRIAHEAPTRRRSRRAAPARPRKTFTPSTAARRAAVERYGLTARALAIHEAGHAVMRVLLGGTLEHVRLHWTEGANGRPRLRGGSCRGVPGEAGTVETALAGRAAVDVASAYSPELRGALEGFHDRGDVDAARPLVERRHGPDHDLYRHVREVAATLRRHWAAVLGVADALLDRDLTDRDVRAIVLSNVDDITRRQIERLVA